MYVCDLELEDKDTKWCFTGLQDVTLTFLFEGGSNEMYMR